MRGGFGGGMASGGHGSAGAQSTQQNAQQQGTNTGNAVDRYGNPVQCHACGEWGHFWRYCEKWLAFMNSGGWKAQEMPSTAASGYHNNLDGGSSGPTAIFQFPQN
eukprot:1989187-Rhodomonas_salina.1